MIEVKFKKLRDNFKMPEFKKGGDACADVHICAFKYITDQGLLVNYKNKQAFLNPLQRIGCCLGFATEIPEGYYAQLVPRSGLALSKGLTIVNSPGTIDSGYRGEWIAIVANISNSEIELNIGDRIAQFRIEKLIDTKLTLINKLSRSERGKNGFGSTGGN